ncbi:hypothetical protein [Roseicyclus sp.]|uniref:hypothetical protein n=1 Tax=Roseicyclus sp. TaxID=1914329 RepID=UPI003F6C63DC
MTENPLSPNHVATPREEKLKAIAAIFGDAVAARLGSSHAGDTTPRNATGAVDADRVAWQTNRLIQHLRQRTATPSGAPSNAAPKRPSPASPPQSAKAGPRPLPPLMAGEDLAAEHPAVIAHMLRDAPQEMRVAVLRALPGHVARMVMRRLRIS